MNHFYILLVAVTTKAIAIFNYMGKKHIGNQINLIIGRNDKIAIKMKIKLRIYFI